jgi:hypothetical protein
MTIVYTMKELPTKLKVRSREGSAKSAERWGRPLKRWGRR